MSIQNAPALPFFASPQYLSKPPEDLPASTPRPAATLTAADLKPRVLVDDGNVRIEQKLEADLDEQGNLHVSHTSLTITTGNSSDILSINKGAEGQLIAWVNGKKYPLNLTNNEYENNLEIHAQGGNDHIRIDPGVKIPVKISGGDGDDRIIAGSGKTIISGDNGNDTLSLGDGPGIIFGGNGDDILFAGSNNAVLSGGKGNDQLYAGYGNANRQVHLNGDQGDDCLIAGTGKTVLNGGRGNDVLIGTRQTTFYTGAGQDRVHSFDARDRIYANNGDSIHNQRNAKVTYVEPTDAGKAGFKIEGTEAFIERTEDVIDQLRGSPVGQQMLKTMDQLAEKNGSAVTLKASKHEYSNAYSFNNDFSDTIPDDEYDEYTDHPGLGFIKDGVPGSVATRAELIFAPTRFDEEFLLTPKLALYHEMVHAFNGATGTLIPGTQPVIRSDGTPYLFNGTPWTQPNLEYQAVGLPTPGTPFDFDGDPLTPPTTENPHPFTENALREEMGVPLRKNYPPV